MTPFLVIGVIGLALLAISLILGDLFGGAFDALAGDIFSSAVIGGFVAAFGFGAAIAEGAGAPLVLSIPIGAVAGGGFGWFAAWLTRILRGGGNDDTPVTADALGRDATVLTDIPADGFGLVRVRFGGHPIRLNARAEAPIAVGVDVHVTQVLSPTAVVVAPTHPELELPTDLGPPTDPNPLPY